MLDGFVICENVIIICIPATLVVSECVAVTTDPANAQSIFELPIVAVHPVETTVKSLGIVNEIFPLFERFGKVYTVVNFTFKLQVALIAVHPLLSSEVDVNGFGKIVIELVYDPIPISEVEVFVVT